MTVWKWDQQEPFGHSLPDENPSGQGSFEFPLRFPAGIGRYLEADPAGAVSQSLKRLVGLNDLYTYVGANPLSLVDPKGLIAIPSLPSSPNTCQAGNPPPNRCYSDCMTTGFLACAAATGIICGGICSLTRAPGCMAFCPPVIFTPCILQVREECKMKCNQQN